MIGNLISAIGVAVLSASIVIAGDVQARNVSRLNASTSYVSTSNINGTEVRVYLTANVNFASGLFYNSTDALLIRAYNLDGTFDTSYRYDNDESNFGSTSLALSYFENLDLDTSHFYLMNVLDSFNGETYIYSRLFYPTYAGAGNVEFALQSTNNVPTGYMYLFYDKPLTNYYYSYNFLNGDDVNWFGYSRSTFFSNATAIESGMIYDFGFYECGFFFKATTTNTYLTINFVSEYPNQNSGSTMYDTGYAVGFNEGSSQGYAKGYADAMALATQNGTFSSLFNSVADTPLRFLYGLFSFDLFGTSVLVIILTLLTGIAVFAIIKRVWK